MQIVDGLKAAIDTGKYRKGDALPSRDALAKGLGVSECIVRRALSRVAAEGLVVGRPRIGYTVARQKSFAGFGSILFVNSGYSGSYNACAGEQAMRLTLLKAGYRPLSIYLGDERAADYDVLKRALAEHPDFVVIRAARANLREVIRLVERANVPHDTCLPGVKSASEPAGLRRRHDYGTAVRDFVADCVRKGVMSVWQCDFGKTSMMNAVPLLRWAGISAVRKPLFRAPAGNLEAMQQGAVRELLRLLKTEALPDLIFFTDDYLTIASLPVLLERGIAIPDDVRVVTFANRGFGPVFTKSFARIEVDPYQAGIDYGTRLIEWIRTGRSQSLTPSAVYIPGETFPSKARKEITK